MKRAPLSTAEKRLLIGSAFAVPLIVAAGTVLFGDPNGGIPPRAALPKPNGFDLYLAAASLMTRPNPPVDAVNDTKIRTPAQAAKFYTPARRAAFVGANSQVWSLMRQARAVQTEHPDTRLSFGTPPFRYGALRDLARGKTIEAKHFKDLKRFDLALQSGLDTIEMGRDVEHGAPLLGSLVGIAVEAIGGISLDDVPPHLSAKEAKNGARRLEKIIASGASPAEILTEEKWTVLTEARQGFSPQSKRWAGIVSAPLIARVVPVMDSCIAQVGKSFALQKMPPPPSGILNSFEAVIAHNSFSKSGFHFARREATESNLLVRLALRAYRLEHGAYPGKLAALVPQYLVKIPRDAFGRGEPLRYRKTGDSYLAWSIGPDGKDNGGTSIPISPSKKRFIILKTSRGDAVTKP